MANKNIPIYGDGKNIRDWLFVEDHISALEKILENGINGESYNIGGGYEISNHDLAKVICRKLDSKFSKREGTFSRNISFTDDRLGHDSGIQLIQIKFKNFLIGSHHIHLMRL